MATRSLIECPFCREVPESGRNLEDHLIHDHRKRELAKFVATEVVAMEEEEIS